MMDFELLKKAAAKAAGENGISEYELYYSSSAETAVATLNCEQNSFSSGETAGICVRVLKDGRLGYAASQLLTDEEIERLVLRASENAVATEKLDTVGIYSGGKEYPPFKECVSSEKLGASELKNAALGFAGELYSHAPLVKDGTETSAFSASLTVRLANSHGVDCSVSGSICALSAEAVVCRNGVYENSYDVRKIDGELDVRKMADELVSTAEKKLGAVQVDSGRYDVIIDGKTMRSILSAFSSVFSAKNAQMGLSLLAGKVGEKVASDKIDLTDDPMREGVSLRTYFDAEGAPAVRKSVIEKGVLKTLLHNRETALKEGRETTGNASKAGYAAPVSVSPYALCIEPGAYSREALVALLGNGILVTEVKGLHAGVNAISGDFSLEAAGFAVKGGKVAEAVRSFTVAGNFFELLKSVEALGDEVSLGISGSFTTFGSPDILVKGVSVAGK